MSLEDETENTEIELKELVTQTLEDNGVLSKIRAQLRAGLYLALENDINSTDFQLNFNNKLKSKLTKPDVRLIFCLVREFLEYFQLDFTCSVFEKETFLGTSYTFENRDKLVQDLDIGIDTLHDAPLLLEVLNIARSSFHVSVRDVQNDVNFNNTYNTNTDASKELTNSTFEIPSSQDELLIKSDSISEIRPVTEIKAVLKDSVATNKNDIEEESHQSIPTKNDDVEEQIEIDNTYEDTSSIADDSEQKLIDFDKSVKLVAEDSSKSPNQSDRRTPDKLEKLKPMSGLSSLSDLPPLQLNKSRNSDTVLLPSLYSKDFREKSSLKEIDKLLDFDSLDNYEEDFMSSGSHDLNIYTPVNKVELSLHSELKLDKRNGDEMEMNDQDSGSTISENMLDANADDSMKSS